MTQAVQMMLLDQILVIHYNRLSEGSNGAAASLYC
jgi:hypothetical protein